MSPHGLPGFTGLKGEKGRPGNAGVFVCVCARVRVCLCVCVCVLCASFVCVCMWCAGRDTISMIDDHILLVHYQGFAASIKKKPYHLFFHLPLHPGVGRDCVGCCGGVVVGGCRSHRLRWRPRSERCSWVPGQRWWYGGGQLPDRQTQSERQRARLPARRQPHLRRLLTPLHQRQREGSRTRPRWEQCGFSAVSRRIALTRTNVINLCIVSQSTIFRLFPRYTERNVNQCILNRVRVRVRV